MKRQTIKYTDIPEEPSSRLQEEVATMPGVGEVINVRAAKAQLSALLDWVARGHDIIITSNGKPKARLSAFSSEKPRKVFQGMGDFLSKQKVQTEGPFADEIVRADRDGRGW